MVRRRIWFGLVILEGAALAVVALLGLTSCKAKNAGEQTAADMAVHVGKISRATLRRLVTAYGKVEPEPPVQGRPPAHAHVGSPVSGVLAEVDCREGQKVTKGTLLFRLDSRLAEVTHQRAKNALQFSQANYERQKKLIEAESTSIKNFQEAEQQLNVALSALADAETNLEVLRIRATFDGTVVKINTEPGEAVEANTVLATIIDLNRLVVSVNIPSREAVAVKTGQAAQFDPLGLVTGRVVYVGSDIDPKTDTVPVRVSVPQAAGFLLGQFLRVHILTEEHKNCLVVSEASVIVETVTGQTGEIVVVEGNKALRKSVKIGLREAGLVEVEAEGLKEGTVIVTEDAYAVPDQTKIHIID